MIYNTNGPISSWSIEERPREKLKKRGTDALTDAELIAIILRSGSKTNSALQVAGELLNDFGGLENLARTSLQELKSVLGMGDAKAMALLSAFELGRRKIATHQQPLRITSSETAAHHLMAKLSDLQQEVFYILLLNRNNEIQAEKKLFQGGISSTIIDPRIVFREALQQLSSSIIIAHNHPSGSLTPSEADRRITEKLMKGAEILDLKILDHIIVSQRGYFSFADEGLLT
ncbi:MAG: DNA repair protein RadC [Bacteroidota bacterium]